MDEKITVEASAELEQVIAHAEAGEEVEITRNGAVGGDGTGIDAGAAGGGTRRRRPHQGTPEEQAA